MIIIIVINFSVNHFGFFLNKVLVIVVNILKFKIICTRKMAKNMRLL